MKVRPHSDYLAEIKEEVIEFNKSLGLIIRYVAVIERAQNDLGKLAAVWKDKEQRDRKREFFTWKKVAFYCF